MEQINHGVRKANDECVQFDDQISFLRAPHTTRVEGVLPTVNRAVKLKVLCVSGFADSFRSIDCRARERAFKYMDT